MAITVLAGPPGSGKSKRLIEIVKTAQHEGRPVLTVLSRDAVIRATDPNVWAHGRLGCRQPGLSCTLDYLVSSTECGEVLRKQSPGTLAVFDEAHYFDTEIAHHWVEASHRGMNVLVATPSPLQLKLLEDTEYEMVRLTLDCERCGEREATRAIVFPGEMMPTALCTECDGIVTAEAHAEIIDRLRKQEPYPGEEILYQPVELQGCAGWKVIRVDSQKRVDLMLRIIEEYNRTVGPENRCRTYLDIGCNTGYFCAKIARSGLAARGVDVVSGDIAVARLLSTFVRRDYCRYILANSTDYLRETRAEPIDVTSAFSVFQWVMLQSSVDDVLKSIKRLFEKTSRLCFLEFGYSDEDIYQDRLPVRIDQSWVYGIMRAHGEFEDVEVLDAKEHGLMRDLFVGFKTRHKRRRNSDKPPQSANREASEKADERGLVASLADVSVYDEPTVIVRRVAPLLRKTLAGDAKKEQFRLLEREGIHVTPVHFYEPIPDTQNLPDSLWERESELVGLEMNVEAQLSLVRDIFPRYAEEYNKIPVEPTGDPREFHLGNGLFAGTDALSCYCMVRHFTPRQIIEIGSGFSTLLLMTAAAKTAGAEILVVDPNPSRDLAQTLVGKVSLRRDRVEDADIGVFSQLGADDILFVDSSHVVRTGGDVTFLFLEVLPRLAPGVLIHFH